MTSSSRCGRPWSSVRTCSRARRTGTCAGTGRWRLWSGLGTAVTYEWDVETTISWMNAVAPIGRPVFHWSHDVVMRNGGRGLAELLGARLLVCD